MADNEKITTKLSVDVTDFKKGLSDANRYIRLANSEFEKATAGAGKFADSADGLKAKLTQLEKTLEGQEAAAAVLRHEYERVCKEQGENSKGAQELAIKLNKQEAACKKTASQIDHYKSALDDMERTADDAGSESKTLSKNLDDVAGSAKKADKATDGVAKDMPGTMGKAATAAGKLARKLASIGGKAIVSGIKGIGKAAGGLVTAFLATAETSKEWTGNMNKLASVAQESGRSTEAVKKQFTEFYGILGDETAATTTASNLEAIGLSEKNLAGVTNSMAGIWAKYGDSIPLDGLAESINETSRVGQVTGGLADALNWAGISEDNFNKKLEKCSSEQERQQLIVDTLDGAYGKLGETYKEQNANIIESNKANAALQDALAGVGNAAMPVMTTLKMLGASVLKDLLPGIQELGTAFKGVLSGDAGAAADMGAALSGIITQLLDKITTMAPQLVQVAMSLITSLSTSLISMLPQLVTTGVQLITSIIDGLTTALPQIIQAISGMIPQLVQALVTGIPQIIQGAVQLLLAIVQAIPQLIPPLVAAIPQITMAIINGLLAALPQLLQGAVQFLTAIIQAIPQLINMLVPQIPTIVTTIIDGLLANIPVLLQGALQLLKAIVDAIPLLIQALVPQVPTIIDTVINALIEATPVLLDAAVQLLMALVEAIPQIVMALLQNLPQILDAILSVLSAMPRLIWGILVEVLGKAGAWLTQMVNTAIKTGTQFLSSLVGFFAKLPGQLWTWLKNTISKVASWASNMAAKAKSAGTNFVNSAVNIIKGLPGKIWTWLSNAVGKVATWGTNMLSKAKSGMSSVVNGVVSTLRNLPGKMLSIGTDIVKGLWNGISNMTSWVIGKIQGFGDSVLGGIKKFFGIASPSKLMRDEVGKWLPAGLAVGVEANTKEAVKAMENMARQGVRAANTELAGANLTVPVAANGAAGNDGNAGGKTYIFNQYNNSPKALSRREIYRQTKNALRFATGNA